LPERPAWSGWAESPELPAHAAKTHVLSICFCISAHGSNFCRKGVGAVSEPGSSLLQLPLPPLSAWPLVRTSTTVASCLPRGNRVQGQGCHHAHDPGHLPAVCISSYMSPGDSSQVTLPFSHTAPESQVFVNLQERHLKSELGPQSSGGRLSQAVRPWASLSPF
jgi:hypothetical protein